MKKALLSCVLLALLLGLCGCASGADESGANTLLLSDEKLTFGGAPVGTDASAPVYLSHDIIYYEDRLFYDSGMPYGEGSAAERHSAEEAAAQTVVNITKPGTYRVCGQLSAGQLRVDLGEEARYDPNAVVTLILDGADIRCDIAPAVLFLNVYECDALCNAATATAKVDTSAAGARLILADGSVNNIVGSHVARIYKDKAGEKKLWKQDAAFYSYMSMSIDGDGTLNITADNEGLDSELHLTVNGGNINIRSQDDGINVNEDNISVVTVNGGNVHILAGLGAEGDGIDSNGWLVINGGTVISMANPASDAGLDSSMGSFINGGTVIALGSTMDWPESDSAQVTMNLQFSARQNAGDAIVITDAAGRILFAYDPSEDEVASSLIREYQGAVLSSSALVRGETVRVFLGGTVTGSESAGVYDPDSITAYTGGVQQSYTGNTLPGGRPSGVPDGQQPPEPPTGELPSEFDSHQPPTGFFGGSDGDQPSSPPTGELPGEFDSHQPPTGFFGGSDSAQPPEPPDGDRPSPDNSDGQRPPDIPDGQQAPEGDSPDMPGRNAEESGSASVDFVLTERVNSFSGVRAA